MSITNLPNINVQSIKNKSIQLNNFIINNNIKIAALTETWLREDGVYLNLPDNYSIIRKDQKHKPGGGIALIHHNSIKINQAITKQDYLSDEVLILNAKHDGRSYDIIIIYAPPDSTSNFEYLNKYLNQNNKEVIIMGDLNAKHTNWFCPFDNRKGFFLNNVIFENNLVIINNNSPTYKFSKNILDLFLVTASLACNITNFKVHNEVFISDHHAVTCQLEAPNSCSAEIIEIKLHSKIDWVDFNKTINDKLKSIRKAKITSKEDLNVINEYFSNIVTSTLNDLTPTALVKMSKTKSQTLPKNVIVMIKEKRKLILIFSKTHCPTYKSAINKISNCIKTEIKKVASIRWNELCNIKSNDKPAEAKFWKKLKQVENGKAQRETILPNHLISDEEKADKLAVHFKEKIEKKNKKKFDKMDAELKRTYVKKLFIHSTTNSNDESSNDDSDSSFISRAKQDKNKNKKNNKNHYDKNNSVQIHDFNSSNNNNNNNRNQFNNNKRNFTTTNINNQQSKISNDYRGSLNTSRESISFKNNNNNNRVRFNNNINFNDNKERNNYYNNNNRERTNYNNYNNRERVNFNNNNKYRMREFNDNRRNELNNDYNENFGQERNRNINSNNNSARNNSDFQWHQNLRSRYRHQNLRSRYRHQSE